MAFVKVKEIIKEAPAFAQLTDLAAERLAEKCCMPQMISSQKKKT